MALCAAHITAHSAAAQDAGSPPPITVTNDGQVTVNNNSFLPPGECSGANSSIEECQSAIPNNNPEMRGVDASAATLIDYEYARKEFKCLPDREVWGSCPEEAMPHKRTELLSFSDLSPHLWTSLRDPSEPARKYEGPYYRNQPGSRRDVHAIISSLNNTSERFAGCTHQIEVPDSTSLSLSDEAKVIRLQLDNCANQYILNTSLYPAQKSNPKIPISERRCETPIDIAPSVVCQPLRMSMAVAETNEYHVGTYLRHSWIRLKQNPEHKMPRKRGFGPFTGLIGKVMAVMRSAMQIAGTFTQISNLASMVNFTMPDVGNIMGQIQNSFGNIVQNIQNLPAQLTSSINNLTNMVQNFPQAFSNLGNVAGNLQNLPNMFVGGVQGMTQAIQNLPANLTEGFGNLTQSLQNLPDLMNNVGAMAGNLQNLPNALGDISGVTGILQQLPDTLSNVPAALNSLQSMPDTLGQIANVGDTFGAIGNSIGNVGNTFDSLMNSPEIQQSLGMVMDVPGNIATIGAQAGHDFVGMIGDQAVTAEGLLVSVNQNTGQLLGVDGKATDLLVPGQWGDVNYIAYEDAGDVVASDGAALNQMGNDLAALGQIGGQLGSLGNLDGAIEQSGAMQQALGQIDNVGQAGSNIVSIAGDVANVNHIAGVMNSDSVQGAMQIQGDIANVTAAMGDLQQLDQLFSNIQVQEALQGYMMEGTDFSALTNVSQSFSALTGTLDVINMDELNGVMGMVGDLQGTFTGALNADLAGITGQLTGAAQAFTNLNPLNSTMNELNALKDSVMGSLNFGLNFNMPDMNLNKNPDPRLPKGTLIVNELPPPDDFPDITLGMLAASPYEEILDPSHPFSPRWHYHGNDRDMFSPWGIGYSESPTDNVYCAGDAEEQKTKVDILEFRRKRIEEGENALYDGMWQRLMFNDMCKRNMGGAKNPCYVMVYKHISSFPFIVTRPKPLPCWACFGLKGKTAEPPCSTRYNQGKDKLSMVKLAQELPSGTVPLYTPPMDGVAVMGPLTPVLASSHYILGGIPDPMIPVPSVGLTAGYAIHGKLLPAEEPLCGTMSIGCKASCTVTNIPAKTTTATLCKELRRPYAPMNKLKMRFHKEGDPRDELPSGVPEGLTHVDYFEDRMPYPLRWDTGTHISETTLSAVPSSGTIEQNPIDTLGQYTAIVGVGREAILEPSGDPNQPPTLVRKDERCLIGGWGDDGDVGGITIETPDPVSSWTELKLYQLRTTRAYHQVCLGRYDKLFKIGGTEDHVLAASGGVYNEINKSCEISPNSIVTTATDAATGQVTSTTEPNPINNGAYNQSIKDLYTAADEPLRKLKRNWPRAWRGYMSDPGDVNSNHVFPKFGGGGSIINGMNNAQPGDILLLPEGSSSRERGLARLAYVKRVSLADDCEDKGGCYINVLERDFGKFPDICGNTDAWGIEANRNLFKPGKMPQALLDAMDALGSDANCEDNDLQNCEFDLWSNAKLYRIDSDERSGAAPSSLFQEQTTDSSGNPVTVTIDSPDRCQLVGSCQELRGMDIDETHLIDPAWMDCCARAGWDVPSSN